MEDWWSHNDMYGFERAEVQCDVRKGQVTERIDMSLPEAWFKTLFEQHPRHTSTETCKNIRSARS